MDYDDSENNPAIQTATQQLFARLKTHLGRPMTEGVKRDVRRTIKEHRGDMRRRGIRYPEMTVVFMPKAGFMEVLRADLEIKGVQTAMINITVKVPHVTREELARGIVEAFPWYASRIAPPPVRHSGGGLEHVNGSGAHR